ncbi:hypothetical protein, partial [Pseudomonas sp. GM78]|uniref:hypothetical protein n=1 Tax=Pseudomonas sp. GM78 TaxID=1144337 RepID=UPI001EE68840
GGAKPFGSFLAFEKGTRRKGETISGRYRSNGYALNAYTTPCLSEQYWSFSLNFYLSGTHA